MKSRLRFGTSQTRAGAGLINAAAELRLASENLALINSSQGDLDLKLSETKTTSFFFFYSLSMLMHSGIWFDTQKKWEKNEYAIWRVVAGATRACRVWPEQDPSRKIKIRSINISRINRIRSGLRTVCGRRLEDDTWEDETSATLHLRCFADVFIIWRWGLLRFLLMSLTGGGSRGPVICGIADC